MSDSPSPIEVDPNFNPPSGLLPVDSNADSNASPGPLAAGSNWGLDYGGYVNPSTLKAHGVTFVARYLREVGLQEIKDLHAAGINVCLIHEYSGTTPRQGFAAGVADAKLANAQADRLGAPDNVVIYYTADFDAIPAEQVAINEYIKGTNTAKRPGGLYGGYWPISRAFDAGVLKWGWQTYAWSGGNFDKRSTLYQYLNNVALSGIRVDYNHGYLVHGSLGEWPAKAAPVPKPGPSGTFEGEIPVNFATGQWRAKGMPGTVALGGPNRWASAKISVDADGTWHPVTPMPWNAPPLGH